MIIAAKSLFDNHTIIEKFPFKRTENPRVIFY